MPSHHFENVGPEPDETNLLQTVQCIYCGLEEERSFEAQDARKPSPLAVRIHRARTVSPNDGCPKAPTESTFLL